LDIHQNRIKDREEKMRMKFERVRLILIPLSAIIVLVLWLAFIGEAPHAQSRKVPTKVPESIVMEPQLKAADSVTSEIRKATNDLLHVPVETKADRDRVSKLGKVVNDQGSFVIALANESISAKQFGDGAYKMDTTVNLPGGSFDPLINPPIETVQPGAASKFGPGYYVVQLGGIATDNVLESIRATGFEVIQYVPNNAFIIYGEASDAARVAENSRVRWVGELSATNKITPTLVGKRPELASGTSMYNIAVFSRADLDSVAEQIVQSSGGQLLAEMPLQQSFFNVVRVAMSPKQLESVASIADVARIDSWQNPQREDERAAQIVAGNFISPNTLFTPPYNPLSQFGVDGTGVTVAVSDDGVSIPGAGGFYLTSANTIDGPLRSSTSGAETGHGHLNASIIAGTTPYGNLDPLGFNYSLGIAPKANIVNIPLLKTGYTGTDANAANDAVVTAGVNTVLGTISNNSWGNGTNSNAYDSLAATYDGLARDASAAGTVDPLLFVFSAGNLGVSGLTRPKVAKNLIAVGSSENLRPELEPAANSVEDMSSFSARGPAADGRVKPDIAAPGQGITGSRAGDCTGVTSCFETNHVYSDGTSHAAPQVAGAAALFYQFWKSGHAGVNPSPAMAKAAILLTGQEMTGVGATNSLPNGDEGWGRINMKYMLNTGVSMKYIDQSVNLLSPGDNVVYTGKIADGSKPFRAALVWTDPPGVSDPALVNNLDLTVNIGGNTFLGNVFGNGASMLGGSADTKNNVEQVWRGGNATDTQVTVRISAATLNGDGIIGNGDTTDQHFALVLYNFTEAAATNFAISGRVVSTAGRGIANVYMVLSNGGGTVATTYTNSFGYFIFPSVAGSQSYTLTPLSKRYTVSPQVVNLGSADMTGVNFTASAGTP
jgi:hypothetical protein